VAAFGVCVNYRVRIAWSLLLGFWGLGYGVGEAGEWCEGWDLLEWVLRLWGYAAMVGGVR
jgi:hypothetical protein